MVDWLILIHEGEKKIDKEVFDQLASLKLVEGEPSNPRLTKAGLDMTFGAYEREHDGREEWLSAAPQHHKEDEPYWLYSLLDEVDLE